MEHVTLFGLIELELDSTAGGTLALSTDLPGDTMAVQESRPIPITTGRRVIRLRLKGTTKGRLYSIKITPTGSGVIRLFGGRLWARMLSSPTWEWYAIPIPPTSEEWTAAQLPIPPTAQDWTATPLPIPPTGDWEKTQLPIKPTPANPEWVDIPVDQ